MVDKILIPVITGLIGAFIVYFMNNIGNRSILEAIVKSCMKQHEDVYHQDKALEVVKNALKDHTDNCLFIKYGDAMEVDIQNLKLAVAWLVKQAGGNPSEFGLVK
jgi:hypothetical protein